MNPWEWFTTTVPAGGAVSAVGVGAFVIAILSDKLMTQAQHLRRVADLVTSHTREIEKLNENHALIIRNLIEHHARELAVQDSRAVDLRESRDGYKEATAIERARADASNSAMLEVAPALEGMLHVMRSLDRALPPAERSATS